MEILLVACGGIGNIVQATPTMRAIINAGHQLDLRLCCNSSKDIQSIFKLNGMRKVFVTDTKHEYDFQMTGPFCPGKKYKARNFIKSKIRYDQHIEEVKVYFNMANQIGIKGKIPNIEVKIGKKGLDPLPNTVAIYPGSKPNWAMKRWDKYDQLAKEFENVLVVGKKEDINSHGKPTWITTPWKWPKQTKFYTGSLSEMTYTLSKCKMFIGNDGGLAHVAAATGIPTYVLFGPSSVIKNKPFHKNAQAIAIDIPCRPCQFQADENGLQIFGGGKGNCYNNMKCMREMSVEFVLKKIL